MADLLDYFELSYPYHVILTHKSTKLRYLTNANLKTYSSYLPFLHMLDFIYLFEHVFPRYLTSFKKFVTYIFLGRIFKDGN